MCVIVVDEHAEHTLKMPLIEDQEPIETLGSNGANKPVPTTGADRAMGQRFQSLAFVRRQINVTLRRPVRVLASL